MNPEVYFDQFINLEKTGEFNYGRTLDRMRRLLDALGHPEKKFPSVVTIAGSKGKTSTATMIASLLSRAGQTAGLYTSPHLVRWNERIQVNQTPIRDEEAAGLIREFDAVFRGRNGDAEKPTYFEVMTALAFLYFAQKKVTTAVLEVGLGGRWDATNVCDADVAVLTPLGLEHLKVLGHSLTEITQEKCGIIKRKSFVITAAQEEEAHAVIQREVSAQDVPLLESPRGLKAKETAFDHLKQVFEIDGPWGKEGPFTIELLGKHQIENALLAYAAVRQLSQIRGWPVSRLELEKGFRSAVCPGRLEAVAGDPVVLLDGAHNAQSARSLAAALMRHFDFGKIWMILGMFRDKDPKTFVEAFQSLPVERIFIVPVQSHRSSSTEEMLWKLAPSSRKLEPCLSLGDALEKARARAASEDGIVVTGSLYLVGEAKKQLTEEVCRVP